MGYFDGLTNASFKKAQSGKTIFFPWGGFGKGRVLVDDDAEAKVRSFIRLYYMVSLPLIIVVSVVLGIGYSIAISPFIVLWYLFKVRHLVAGCPLSDESLSIKERLASSATGHNKSTLWILLICSLLFVVFGTLVIFIGKDSSDKLIGAVAAIWSGICAFAYAYMVKLKRN